MYWLLLSAIFALANAGTSILDSSLGYDTFTEELRALTSESTLTISLTPPTDERVTAAPQEPIIEWIQFVDSEDFAEEDE